MKIFEVCVTICSDDKINLASEYFSEPPRVEDIVRVFKSDRTIEYVIGLEKGPLKGATLAAAIELAEKRSMFYGNVLFAIYQQEVTVNR